MRAKIKALKMAADHSRAVSGFLGQTDYNTVRSVLNQQEKIIRCYICGELPAHRIRLSSIDDNKECTGFLCARHFNHLRQWIGASRHSTERQVAG